MFLPGVQCNFLSGPIFIPRLFPAGSLYQVEGLVMGVLVPEGSVPGGGFLVKIGEGV